jgi:carboxyl-terminal processing protease
MKNAMHGGRSLQQVRAMLIVVGLVFVSQTRADPRYEEVIASSTWKAFVNLAQGNYVSPFDVRSLEASCKSRLQSVETLVKERPIENCIRAAIESLGGSSSYISSKEMAEKSPENASRMAGVGLEMKAHEGGEGYVEIVSPIAGSPAHRAGLNPGDLIYSIDGVLTRSLTLAQAVAALRGEAGTSLTLLVVRHGSKTPLRFVMMREPIAPLASVRVRPVSPGTAYLRVSRFRDTTPNEVIAAVSKLRSADRTPLDNLVLDLRSCYGGLLNSVVGVAALFVPPGVKVLSSKGRRKDANRDFRALPQDYAGKPWDPVDEPVVSALRSARLVILVDDHTAAGAEAVVQTLREQRNAVVVGQATFGAGTIETILPLEDGAAVRLSTAMMYSPSGHSWNRDGIQPDIQMPAPDNLKFELGDPGTDAGLARAVGFLVAK